MRVKKTRIVMMCCAATAAWSLGAAPAGAACVTASAGVRVGTTQKTPIPAGTCVAPTPLPSWSTERVYYSDSTMAVDISVGTVSP